MTRHRPDRHPGNRRHRHTVGEPPAPSPGDLLHDVTAALSDPDPLSFLALASSIVSVFDLRSSDPLSPEPDAVPDAAMLLESFIGYSVPETTALLLAFAQLLPDNHLAQRARREASRRDHPLPQWLLWLDEATPGPAAASVDVLGDAQNTVVSVRFSGGESLTAVVLIDHNLGTVAKDGFVIPASLETFRERYLALADEPDAIRFIDLDPAEARAQITQAIEAGAMMVPRFETDTWPAARPMVEWIIGLLPGGGTGFDQPEWTDEDLDRLADDFLGSQDGVVFTDDDDAIVHHLLWFTTDYSGGDPWRWSFVNVELLLTHWYPRTIMASQAELRRMPTVLRAMVRYAHRLKQIPRALTEETLAAIDEYEPVYRQLITSVGEPGVPGYLSEYEEPDLDELMARYAENRRADAADHVGGEQALAELDDAPLPDEDFRWEGIPEDVRERVAQILRLCDDCADDLFDVEIRTAFRRVLARTAATDPAVFRRRSKDSTAAAAIAWAVASINNRLSQHAGGLTAKTLLAHFGVTGSVSGRAQPFLRAFGVQGTQWSTVSTFGTPEVLTSDRRARLIEIRDGDGPAW